jgi:Xaa-Pro aminopeptidase
MTAGDETHGLRRSRMLEAISGLGADGALISAPGTVCALSGVWLETGAIMPARNPWLAAGADGALALLVDEVEAELVARRCALGGTQLVLYRGSESRRQAARTWIGRHSCRRLAVDLSGISAADMRGLSWPDADVCDASHLAGVVGREKSAAEMALIDRAAGTMTAAVAQACGRPDSVGAPESIVAGGIAGSIYGAGEEWHSVVPIVSSGSNLRVPHARPGARRLGRGDLCRIGARGRFGPFHIMYVRTAMVRADRLDLEARELAELTSVHRRTARVLQAGAGGALGPDRPAGSLRRVPIPAVQGMGFEFKEAPTLDPGSADRLEPGDTALVSTILEQQTGDRLYWQQMAAVHTDDVLMLGTETGTERER